MEHAPRKDVRALRYYSRCSELGSWITMYPFIGYSVRVSSKIDKECEEHWKGRWNGECRVGDSLGDCLSHIERKSRCARERYRIRIFLQFGHVSDAKFLRSNII